VWLALTLFEEATNAYAGFKPSLVDGSALSVLHGFLAKLGVSVSQAELIQYFDSYAAHTSEYALAEGGKLVNNLIAGLAHLCVIVVLVFYAFVQGPRLKSFLFKLSPLPDDQDELIVTKFTLVARSVLIGNGIGSVLQGIVGGLAMALVGLPSPVLWGSVMSIAAFLPLLGVSVVVVPAGVYLMLQGQTAEGVAFIAICLSVALVIENVVKTKLMGVGVHVHEVPLFLGVLGGLAGFGLLGLLYGPLIVAIFLALTDLYMSHYRPQFAARFARRKKSRGSLF
jgi:predicted PurR-regulated permease PerM